MDKQTVDTYNALAKEYDEETAGFWKDFPRPFIDEFIEYANGGGVLSLGSGPGRDALLLKEGGLDVTCMDASASMVALSSSRGLKSVLGTFDNLPFGNFTFDGVWAYTSLLHISKTEIDGAINEIVRILKDGGYLALGMQEGDGEEYRESSGMKLPRLFTGYAKEEIEDLFQKHGFELRYNDRWKPKSKNYLHFIAQKRS